MATITYSTIAVLSLAALVRCYAIIAATSVTPRLVVLTAVALASLVAHARALNIVAQPSKVRHLIHALACLSAR